MRSFNSAMMLSDVLAERENQINIKEELRRLEQVRERKYHEMMKHNNERILEREEDERLENINKKLSVAAIQRDQLQEAKARRGAEVIRDKQEGFALRMAYQKQLEDDEIDAKAVKQREIKALNETRQAQKYLMGLKARALEHEALRDQKIEAHAKRQLEVETKRRDRQKFICEEKQRIRQSMIDEQAARLAETKDSSDKRTEEQCRQVTDEMDRLEFERKQYKLELINKIHKETKYAIEKKQQLKVSQEKSEKLAAEYTSAVLARLDDEDHKKEIYKKEETRQRSAALIHQINAARELYEKEKDHDLRNQSEARKLEEARSHAFNESTQSIIREYAQQGRNIMPMINCLKSTIRNEFI